MPAREVRSKSSEGLIRAVVEQRSLKSDEEIGEIEEALEITYPMYMAALEMARVGRFEREVDGSRWRGSCVLSAGPSLFRPS